MTSGAGCVERSVEGLCSEPLQTRLSSGAPAEASALRKPFKAQEESKEELSDCCSRRAVVGFLSEIPSLQLRSCRLGRQLHVRSTQELFDLLLGA